MHHFEFFLGLSVQASWKNQAALWKYFLSKRSFKYYFRTIIFLYVNTYIFEVSI